jgi:hypothetical protein
MIEKTLNMDITYLTSFKALFCLKKDLLFLHQCIFLFNIITEITFSQQLIFLNVRYEMHEICFYTLLGGSAAMTGKEITLEVMEKKPALLAAIEPRQNEEVVALDNGEIPGDRLGN